MPHIIRQHYLHIEVNGTVAEALALQRARPDIHAQRLVPAIERVLDRCEPAHGHLSVERLDIDIGTLALDQLESGFATAVALARGSDLIATVPERHTGNLRAGMHSFALPVTTPEFTVSMLWHPRLDADPAHRWLRGLVCDVCARQLTDLATQGRAAEA